MKKVLLSVLSVLLFTGFTFAQLTGTKTIPGNYASMAAAITDLNTQGVGAGGVTFNVAAGYTETLSSVTAGLITTTTGSSTNPIIFQKSGAGANPLITAGTPGTGALDNIFCILGTDYITFDGIDIQENAANTTATQQMERGYAVLKASGTDGSQNVTIKNCTITLNKTNMATFAIYSNNITNLSTTQLTVTAASGTNSNNKFYSNTFTNCYGCFYLYGFADATPYAYYDQNNEVGKDGGNTFTNWGGGANAAYGFYCYYQNNIKVANNNWTGTIANAAGSAYCFYFPTAVNANVDIYNNTISMTYNGTGSFYGMYSLAGASGTSNVTNIYNNSVTNCSLPNMAGGTFYGLYMYGGMTDNFYNNNVTNNTYGSATATATGTIYGIYHYCSPTSVGTSNVYGNSVSNNSRIQSAISTGTGYHFYMSGGNGTMNIYNNTVNNLTIGSTSTQYIAYILYSGAKNFYNNTITNILNSNGGTLYSIYNGNGTGNALFYNNKIQNINGLAAGNIIYGVYQSSGANIYFFNNFISELKTPAATGNPSVYGMYLSGGTAIGAYNNTIYLNATSSGSTFGVVGIYASTTPNLELRNNIVVNASTPGATGRVVAYQRSSTTLTSYLATSNNNDFWAGTPGASNLIYYDGTNSDQTLAAFKSRVSPRDASSITENAPFVNITTVPYDIHLKTTVATQCESGGATVTAPVAITTDFDNNPRYPNIGYPNNVASPASAPDVGADEFGGLLLDLTPPNIFFSPLLNTSSLTARTLSTTITDASGLPVSGTGLPRLYWKKFWTGTWNSVQASPPVGNQYSFTFGGGVVLNDSIYYYIVAQDNYTPTNIGAMPSGGASGFTSNPPACSTPPTIPLSYKIVGALCGTFNVGTGQTYTSLTAALADLNNKEVTCPVVFNLTDASYSAGETFPIVINNVPGVSPTNTVTIKPASGVTPTISGNSSTALLKLNQASNIIIDGSNSGGSDKSLTLTNTAASGTTAVFWVGSNGTLAGSTNVTIKNCNIACGYSQATSSFGIFVGASSGLGTSGDDNDNLTILNNTISNSSYGVYVMSSTLGMDDNLLVKNNTLGSATPATSIGYYGVYINGANAPVIMGNEVYNMVTTNSWNIAGINFYANVPDGVIWGNKIHDLQSNGSGGWGAYGISIGYGSATVTNAQILNNLIYNLTTINYSATSTFYNPFGIWLYAGTGHKIYHNNINMSGTQNSTGTSASMAACILYYSSGVTGTDVRDNILASGLVGLAGTQSFCIYAVSGTTFGTINYNDYWPYGTYGVLGYLGANQTTLAAWKIATGQDVNSINLDPVFVSQTNLIPTTALMPNSGTYQVTVPVDYTGVMRSNPPDIGAYEFTIDPLVNTTAAGSITSSTATLNGTINANNFTVNSFFDYGLTTAYGSSVPGVPASVIGSTNTAISGGISGLLPSTLYHYRARGVATPSGLIAYGPDMTFTTASPPPTVVTTAATAITVSGATLNGTVNANGASTAVTFEYGLTVAYGSFVAGVPPTVTGSVVTACSGAISGLSPATLYHYRIKGVNTGGTSNGNDLTFTTLAAPPTVTTNPASSITATTAQLNGTVNANGASTVVSFDWGLTVAYGSNIAATPSPVTGNSPTAVLANLGGLVSGNTYHFRCVGTNAGGTTFGLDQSFLAGCPPVGAAGAITGPNSVCANSTGKVYTVGAITNATGYSWSVPAGASIVSGQNTTTITVNFGTTSGNVSVFGTGPCGNGTPSSLPVTVNPLPFPMNAGNIQACQGSTGNVYTTNPGMTNYIWLVSSGGIITAGGTATSNTCTVTWNTAGPQTVSINYTNASGCTAVVPTVMNVTVFPAPNPTITGQTSMCVNSGFYTYTTEPGFANYNWSVSPGGAITFGQGTNAVQVSWIGSGAQTVSASYTNANGCYPVTPAALAVTVNPVPGAAGTITGVPSTCGGSNGIAYSVAPVSGALSYVWTLPAGATIAFGAGTNAITVNFAGNASSGNITVYANNLCGNGTVSPNFAVTVIALPAAAGTITGQAALCVGTAGVTYTVSPIANATGYTWTVPPGALIVAGNNTNSITVDYSATAVSGNVTVMGSNSCGNGPASTLAVTVNPIPATPVVDSSGYTLTSSAPAGNQWYKDGTLIPGATGQVFTANESGWYWTVVTLNGCSSAESNHVYIVITGVNPMTNTGFSLYPVPNDGKFSITITGDVAQTYNLEIYNSIGLMIYSLNGLQVNGSLEQSIDLRPVPNGVYTFVLRNKDNQVVKKFLVNK